MKFFRRLVSVLLIGIACHAASAVPTPFSFNYDGKPAALGHWKRQRTTRKLDSQRTLDTITYTDPQTNLVVRCVAVEYNDYPTVEWMLYFENAGTTDTPILDSIQALDTQFQNSGGGEFVLHHAVGSTAVPNDFQPMDTPLGPKATLALAPAGGQASSGVWPFSISAGRGRALLSRLAGSDNGLRRSPATPPLAFRYAA